MTERKAITSKAEELAILDRFIKDVDKNTEPGSYLHSFLSRELVSWLQTQIRDDMGCDLYGAWSGAVADADRERAAAARAAQDAAKALEVAQAETVAARTALENTGAAMAKELIACQQDRDAAWECQQQLEDKLRLTMQAVGDLMDYAKDGWLSGTPGDWDGLAVLVRAIRHALA